MKNKKPKQQDAIEKVFAANSVEGFAPLLKSLRQLIVDSCQQVLLTVNTVQVQTHWQIDKHIVEFEHGGEQRAAYCQTLPPQFGQALAAEFGCGFDATNLLHMHGFHLTFPICDALRRKLSWMHSPSQSATCRNFRQVRSEAIYAVAT